MVVNAPQPASTLAELDVGPARASPWTCGARGCANTRDGASYVHVLVNERREAGASLPHTHAQLYALDFVPAAVARERERSAAYASARWAATCSPTSSRRRSAGASGSWRSTTRRSLLAPYALAAALPAAARAAPARARASRTTGRPGAALLHDVLNRLARRLGASPPLNLWVRTAPRGADHFCWRIDVLPRLTHLAGLELGTGMHLNIVAPEHAAAELRDA